MPLHFCNLISSGLHIRPSSNDERFVDFRDRDFLEHSAKIRQKAFPTSSNLVRDLICILKPNGKEISHSKIISFVHFRILSGQNVFFLRHELGSAHEFDV